MSCDAEAYVHGYDTAEVDRLNDQAASLERLIHADIRYPPKSRILEVGCGVGAQTIALARNNPEADIVSFDRSRESLAIAIERTCVAGLTNVEFEHADLGHMPFASASFDHIFMCFVLEHLPEPLAALQSLRRLLRPGGTITVVEGDHGSANFHPDDGGARRVIEALVDLQRAAGGDPHIGRRIYPLLVDAGYRSVAVDALPVYVDGSRPDLAESFTRRTFAAMVGGVRGRAVAGGIMTPNEFDNGIRALLRAAETDGVFCYTFFRGRGVAI